MPIKEITLKVASFFGLSHSDIVGSSREIRIVYARYICIFLCYHYSKRPSVVIQKHLNTYQSSFYNALQQMSKNPDCGRVASALGLKK